MVPPPLMRVRSGSFGAFGPTQQAAISVPNTLPDSWLRSPRKAFGRVGIPSGGRNPALCTKTLRDSSCPGLPRMTGRAGLAAGSRLDDLAPVERKPQGKPDPGKGGGGTPRSGRKHRGREAFFLSFRRFQAAATALGSHGSFLCHRAMGCFWCLRTLVTNLLLRP